MTTAVSLALSIIVARCAPAIGPLTMLSVITYESGARPFAIGDNTTRRSYFPATSDDATAIASTLIERGDDIDVGYAQINIANVRAYGIDIASAFDPCINVRLGAAILRADYVRAVARYGRGQDALFHALSAYNTGGFFAGSGYARGVYATAATLARGSR